MGEGGRGEEREEEKPETKDYKQGKKLFVLVRLLVGVVVVQFFSLRRLLFVFRGCFLFPKREKRVRITP